MHDSSQYLHANPETIAQREARLSEVISRVHSEARLAPPAQMVLELQQALDTQMLTYIVGQSYEDIEHWMAGGDDGAIRQETKQKLVTAYEVLLLFDHFEQPDVLATWIIANDPRLDYRMPAQLIRDGKLEELLTAARSFVLVG